MKFWTCRHCDALTSVTDVVCCMGVTHAGPFYGVNRSLQNSAFDAKRKALFEHSNCTSTAN